MRFIGAVAILLFVSLAARSIPVIAQAGPLLEPRVSFEVVSVKANPSRTRTPMLWQPGGHFVMGLPIFSLVSIGYLVPAYRSDGKLGPGLRRSEVNCDQVIAENRQRNLAGERPTAPPPGARPTCGSVGGATSLTAGAAELTPLIGMLAAALGKPVIDNTGLTGRFDIDFQAAPPSAREGTPLAALPPISTALEDQLGLKMQTGRGSVEVLVVDRLEMPTEN